MEKIVMTPKIAAMKKMLFIILSFLFLFDLVKMVFGFFLKFINYRLLTDASLWWIKGKEWGKRIYVYRFPVS